MSQRKPRSLILLYVVKIELTYEVREAFMGFDDVTNDRRILAIADYTLGVLGTYK